MSSSRTTNRGVGVVLGVAACVLVASVVARAQRGGGGGAAGPPIVPTTASSLVSHPELYVGQQVSLLGTVEQTLTRTTFTVVQGKTPMQKDLLVIAPNLQTAPETNAYVTVVGEAVRFDPAEVARRLRGYTLDLPPDVIEKYKGQPAVFATAVINAANTDLAKKPIVPPTPEEEALDKLMKQVSPGFTALRQSLDSSTTNTALEKAKELKGYFGEVQTFFTKRNTADAIGWATEAQKLTDTIGMAATAGKWDDAKAAATTLNGLCGQCHTAHRERMDDGTYRVKG
ncbi:MAG TPA: hypothetical protein VLT86_01575 [Vicinamibacterales bacterium]|nr:hypothetical protein [Vicinamibacterales bacterium]